MVNTGGSGVRNSMTGFAARRGNGAGYDWVWDLRSVNGKGMDLRLRLPEWIEGLEPLLRAEIQKAVQRGNVSLSLRVVRAASDEAALRLNAVQLSSVLAALAAVENAAMAAGVTLAQATAADVLASRGVLETGGEVEDHAGLRAALMADLMPLLEEFQAARAREGAALTSVISAQLDRIAALVAEAGTEAAARRDGAATALREAVLRVMGAADGLDETRIAQELALLAVKSDVQEELDRLEAHVAAARGLMAEAGPVGRKFDFLTQEFMREANTLCSKAQALALTRIGLDLKTVIDQMREQIQNVE
jgi:uncharacterized protein (TIGR00255 family)